MENVIRERCQELINKGFFKLGLPSYMKSAVENYVFHGIEAGSFLNAVLENSFLGAIQNADINNREKVVEWAEFVVWYLPASCHGSHKKVTEWMKTKRGASNKF